MTTALVIIGAALLIGQIVLLVHIRNLLVIIAGNQQTTHDQAHLDVATTAEQLAAADSRRQTHDHKRDEDVVNTTVKEPNGEL